MIDRPATCDFFVRLQSKGMICHQERRCTSLREQRAGRRRVRRLIRRDDAQICEAYGANRYPFPEDASRRQEMSAEVNGRLQELHSTMDAGVLLVPVPRSPIPPGIV